MRNDGPQFGACLILSEVGRKADGNPVYFVRMDSRVAGQKGGSWIGGPSFLLSDLFFAPASEIKKSENQKN